VADPAEGFPPLVDFCCGKDDEPAHEVNRTAARIFCGATLERQFAVALCEGKEMRFDGLPVVIAFCGVGARVLEVPSPIPGIGDEDAGAYIVALGVDLHYQTCKLKGGRDRPGDGLMDGALTVVESVFPYGRPFVKARIKPANKKSARLFDQHGFEDLGPRAGEHDLFRPPTREPTFRREQTWSLSW
jgi:hypothetical protein